MSLCNLALLGSTGSIGKSALAVARALPDRIRVSLLAAGKNWELLAEQARAFVLAALEMVDYVCLFEEDTPYNLISAVQPDVLVKGGDYAIDNIVGGDIVKKRNGEVVVLPFVEGYSSTRIIEKSK